MDTVTNRRSAMARVTLFMDQDFDEIDHEQLTKRETLDIIYLVLSFTCVVSSLTLVAGSGGMVILSIGGDVSTTASALGMYYVGMSLASLTLTHWVFERHGRAVGFWAGCALSLGGVFLGVLGLYRTSVPLILFANVFLGGGTGVGMYLRFAAIEVVHPAYHSRAMTWTLAGGCLAAFLGPEAGNASTGKMGGDAPNMHYFGVFVVVGVFSVIQAVLIAMIHFPPSENQERRSLKESGAPEGTFRCRHRTRQLRARDVTVFQKASAPDEFWPLLRRPDFLLSVLTSALTWAIMAMPMSMTPVCMKAFGYSPHQSMFVMECHFLSMYLPGFISGTYIQDKGVASAVIVAVGLFLLANLASLAFTEDGHEHTWPWFALVLSGAGWNYAFSGATMWVTNVYAAAPKQKQKVQAASEGFVFLLSGPLIMSSGYIYDWGGHGLGGWRALNLALAGFAGLLGLVSVAISLQTKRTIRQCFTVQNGCYTQIK